MLRWPGIPSDSQAEGPLPRPCPTRSRSTDLGRIRTQAKISAKRQLHVAVDGQSVGAVVGHRRVDDISALRQACPNGSRLILAAAASGEPAAPKPVVRTNEAAFGDPLDSQSHQFRCRVRGSRASTCARGRTSTDGIGAVESVGIMCACSG